jgi:hypothetical protein
MKLRAGAAGAALAVAVCAGSTRASGGGPGCVPRASAGYAASVTAALASPRDVWGERLLRGPAGPTLAGASGHLAPLLYARTSKGRPLTPSGVYYVPFAQPGGPLGAGTVNLHVADGSEILSGRTGGPGLVVSVAGERFGSCLRRLGPARLRDGWLPVLETSYRGFRQESFAARIPETGSLVSFVHVTGPGAVRLTPTVRGLERRGNRLVRGGRTYLVFSADARRVGASVVFPHGGGYAAWLDPPSSAAPFELDAARYAEARASVAGYWRSRLDEGAGLFVPEPAVENAARALLVQNLELAWRYSIGNPYEEFSFPESLDAAQVMAELGYGPVAAAIVRVSFTRQPTGYPAWSMGEKLLAAATYVRLSGDRGFLAAFTPTLRGYVAALRRRQEASGLLEPERFSSDIPDSVQTLHGQAVAWEGLAAIAGEWAAAGRTGDARSAGRVAARLGTALRAAVRASEQRLPGGSVFVPMRLGGGERAYTTVTEDRAGSYWNLVAPYALASGLFPAASAEARGALAYLFGHGSRLLGLVRAGGYALYGPGATPTRSGTDQVYGVNASRFLAAEDQPDQLVLSLYGQLAAGMTPKTFVAGEAASVAPLDGLRYRAMYLPPNGVANDAFLETLRLMLVQESAAGVRLAFATPRGWLTSGKRLAVERLPTRFGPVSYSLEASRGSVRVHVDPPSRRRPPSLLLRLRLPRGERIRSISPRRPFDAATGTIDLTAVKASLDLVVRTT